MAKSYMTVLACLGIAASAASADMISVVGSVGESTETTGCNFLADIDWSYLGGSSGTVTIDLTNTTSSGVGGYLTGFVFNIDSTDPSAAASLFSTTNSFFLDTGPESAPPFGSYDAGAALGADWTGGGSPNKGIAVGNTDTFVFNVTASDASSLSASSFALSGPSEFNFVARFKGLADGRSDKVPVPTPGGMALMSLGGLIASRRMR